MSEEIFETYFWRVVLAKNQTYLGYCIVTLKRRDCGDIADLTKEELLDFHSLTKKLEMALRESFGATMFNWSCLMNLAYQNTPPNPHVHWHCRPRYEHGASFAGQDFPDKFFGQHYEWPQVMRVLDASTRKMVVQEIQNFMINDEILQCFDEHKNPTIGRPRSVIKTEPRQYWYGLSKIWVVNSKAQILCSKRSLDTADPGLWQTYFGGHLPFGLSFTENAVKELREESGIEVQEQDLFLIEDGINEEKKNFFESFVVLYNGENIDITKTDGEVTEAKWMDMDDYWQEQAAYPEKWCCRCKPKHQKLIKEWLKKGK